MADGMGSFSPKHNTPIIPICPQHCTQHCPQKHCPQHCTQQHCPQHCTQQHCPQHCPQHCTQQHCKQNTSSNTISMLSSFQEHWTRTHRHTEHINITIQYLLHRNWTQAGLHYTHKLPSCPEDSQKVSHVQPVIHVHKANCGHCILHILQCTLWNKVLYALLMHTCIEFGHTYLSDVCHRLLCVGEKKSIASYFLNQEVFLSLSEKQCCRVFLIFPGLSHQDDSGDVLAPAHCQIKGYNSFVWSEWWRWGGGGGCENCKSILEIVQQKTIS